MRAATLPGERGEAFDLLVEGLSAGYGRREIVHDLTLEPIPAGRLVALVGPNAAGKSTLLRALAGLVRARGSIRLGDAELVGASPAQRARSVAFMPQSLPDRVGLTVLEGVLSALHAAPGGDLTGGEARRRALCTLERLEILDIALSPLDELSGGQRQLASFAQALVREPRLLLLDEPTSALDLRHQLRVMNVARGEAREGRVVVVVLHDLGLAARWADTVVVLDRGRIRSAGKPHLALTPDILRQVYGVRGRVERCSEGCLQVLVDGVQGGRG